MKNRQKVVVSHSPEDLIQIAIEKGGGTLNLNESGLDSEGLAKLIPTIKEQLPNLTQLYLNGNNFDSLPDNIGELSNLEYIEVKYNEKLKTLPDSLRKLTELKWLSLFDNNFKDLPYDNEKTHPTLKKISLENNPLSLVSLLKIVDDESLKELYSLDQNIIQKAEHLKDKLSKFLLANIVAKSHPDISVKDFYEFLESLSLDQIEGITASKFSYSLDSKGKLKLSSVEPSKSEKDLIELTKAQNEQFKPKLKMQRSLSESQLSDKFDLSQEEPKKTETSEKVERRKIFNNF